MNRSPRGSASAKRRGRSNARSTNADSKSKGSASRPGRRRRDTQEVVGRSKKSSRRFDTWDAGAGSQTSRRSNARRRNPSQRSTSRTVTPVKTSASDATVPKIAPTETGMETWNLRDVEMWVRGFRDSPIWVGAGKTLSENQVDGIGLLNATLPDLVEMGIRRIHARSIIGERDRANGGGATLQALLQNILPRLQMLSEGGRSGLKSFPRNRRVTSRESRDSSAPRRGSISIDAADQKIEKRMPGVERNMSTQSVRKDTAFQRAPNVDFDTVEFDIPDGDSSQAQQSGILSQALLKQTVRIDNLNECQQPAIMGNQQDQMLAEISALRDQAATFFDSFTNGLGEENTLGWNSLLANGRVSLTNLNADFREELNGLKEKKQEMEESIVFIEKLLEENTPLMEKQKTAMEELANAKETVGNIRPRDLAELKTLRKPPDVLHHVIAGALSLMGTKDTRWSTCRSFLLDKGFKTKIATFDYRQVTEDRRLKTHQWIDGKKNSFVPEVAGRCSKVAGSLCAWLNAFLTITDLLAEARAFEAQFEGKVGNIFEVGAQLQQLKNDLSTLNSQYSLPDWDKVADQLETGLQVLVECSTDYNNLRPDLNAFVKDMRGLDEQHRQASESYTAQVNNARPVMEESFLEFEPAGIQRQIDASKRVWGTIDQVLTEGLPKLNRITAILTEARFTNLSTTIKREEDLLDLINRIKDNFARRMTELGQGKVDALERIRQTKLQLKDDEHREMCDGYRTTLEKYRVEIESTDFSDSIAGLVKQVRTLISSISVIGKIISEGIPELKQISDMLREENFEKIEVTIQREDDLQTFLDRLCELRVDRQLNLEDALKEARRRKREADDAERRARLADAMNRFPDVPDMLPPPYQEAYEKCIERVSGNLCANIKDAFQLDLVLHVLKKYYIRLLRVYKLYASLTAKQAGGLSGLRKASLHILGDQLGLPKVDSGCREVIWSVSNVEAYVDPRVEDMVSSSSRFGSSSLKAGSNSRLQRQASSAPRGREEKSENVTGGWTENLSEQEWTLQQGEYGEVSGFAGEDDKYSTITGLVQDGKYEFNIEWMKGDWVGSTSKCWGSVSDDGSLFIIDWENGTDNGKFELTRTKERGRVVQSESNFIGHEQFMEVVIRIGITEWDTSDPCDALRNLCDDYILPLALAPIDIEYDTPAITALLKKNSKTLDKVFRKFGSHDGAIKYSQFERFVKALMRGSNKLTTASFRQQQISFYITQNVLDQRKPDEIMVSEFTEALVRVSAVCVKGSNSESSLVVKVRDVLAVCSKMR